MTNDQKQDGINQDFLTALRGIGEVQRGHHELITSLFRILGCYGAVLDTQLPAAAEPGTADTTKAREILQAANTEVAELRRLYALEPKPEQPN